MNWSIWLQIILLIATFSFFGGLMRVIAFDRFVEPSEKRVWFIVGALMCIAHILLFLTTKNF